MSFKIELTQGNKGTTIKAVGRLEAPDLAELKAQLGAAGTVTVMDLGEVSLVSIEVVRFLEACESQGIHLLNCAAYIRQWIDKERATAIKE